MKASFRIKLVINCTIVGEVSYFHGHPFGQRPVDPGTGLKSWPVMKQKKIQSAWENAVEAARSGSILAVIDALYPDGLSIFDEIRIS